MSLTYTDALGTVLDTGINVAASPRANVEVEVHSTTEVDTGSKLTTTQTVASHVPHRSPNSPR